jgi:hypothetical protein
MCLHIYQIVEKFEFFIKEPNILAQIAIRAKALLTFISWVAKK